MKKTILLIEDEKDMVVMISARLNANGYSVVTALDGEEGLKVAGEIKPDLILLDIIMPKINGFEVCSRLKKNPETSSIPVVIITASGIKNVEKKCVEAGAEDFIHKPYDAGELLNKISKLTR
jgi:CheY-like chemotaxis protein